MTLGQSKRDFEATRPCTVCRMPVSVLAIKCHHCGAEVGRPKEAARSLSAEDLGGETIVHYAPSSNVMDALEAFRSEETAAKAAAKEEPKTLFGRKARSADGVTASLQQSAGGLPELDERSRALASIAMPRRPTPAAKKRQSKIDFGEIGRYAAYAIGAVVILYVGVFHAPGWVKAFMTPEAVVFVSRYGALKETGAEPIALLEAAAEAMRNTPTDQYRLDVAEARQGVIAQVKGMLDSPSATRASLGQASALASRALGIDPAPEIRDLKVEAESEVRLYTTTLISFDAAAKTATFGIPGTGGNTTVKEGDLLAERLKVAAVAATEVRLEDTQRGGRTIVVAGVGPILK